MLSQSSFLDRAGQWFIKSGIQEHGGGVARYYLADRAENRAVSTEITGYAVSALTYLYSLNRNPGYLDAADRAASFLTRVAWDSKLRIFPFECAGDERFAYFFDCGIIIRGLLSLWRVNHDGGLLEIAKVCGQSMASSFAAGPGEYHPILRLPGKSPAARNEQWSRSPGCYQLKSALAWHDLHRETGESDYLEWYEGLLSESLRTHESFLPGAEGDRVMDRLHAYCYFLEALLPRTERAEVRIALAWGIEKVAHLRRKIGPAFLRSDVCAQLLRVRLLADHAGAVPLDRKAADAEAQDLAAFQILDGDPRIRGGFYFARRGSQMQPHVNPVSTSFGLQALAMWRQYLNCELPFSTDTLV